MCVVLLCVFSCRWKKVVASNPHRCPINTRRTTLQKPHETCNLLLHPLLPEAILFESFVLPLPGIYRGRGAENSSHRQGSKFYSSHIRYKLEPELWRCQTRTRLTFWGRWRRRERDGGSSSPWQKPVSLKDVCFLFSGGYFKSRRGLCVERERERERERTIYVHQTNGYFCHLTKLNRIC